MPIWSGVLEEIKAACEINPHGGCDVVRRKYLVELHRHTGRSVILYATRFLQGPAQIPGELISIVDEDLQGIMETVHALPGDQLDLILHSPGGSPVAAEGLVEYLRSKFSHIRVIVPMLAQSAATMMCCAADEIVLGKHSYLGPTDPQINTHVGFVPAQAVTEQFERALMECQDPKKLPAWLPMLTQYGPHLLVVCDNATKLSRELVSKWLRKYMFHGEQDADAKAEQIATWLANHGEFKTHGRHIPRDQLAEKGLKVTHLEDDQALQDLVLSVFHATTHTFSGSIATKIIENHLGKAFMKLAQPQGQPFKPVSPQSIGSDQLSAEGTLPFNSF